MNYQEGINRIQDYTAGAPVLPVLEFIEEVHRDKDNTVDFLDQVGLSDKYPDSMEGLLLFLGSIIRKRKLVTSLYDRCLDRYQTVSEISGRRRATDDESKIKETLTDYILRVEKNFEINDLTDESVVKELNRFVNESSLTNLTEGELQKLIVSSKTMTLLEPHLDRLREIYYGYEKLIDPLTRLVRIADYIIEEGHRKVS